MLVNRLILQQGPIESAPLQVTGYLSVGKFGPGVRILDINYDFTSLVTVFLFFILSSHRKPSDVREKIICCPRIFILHVSFGHDRLQYRNFDVAVFLRR